MTRTMYDGINLDSPLIPTTAQLVAGYVDGRYAWSAADWARFPNSVHVPIAVWSTTNNGVVLDVEQGNASPAESVNWVLDRRATGVDPSIYCSLNLWPTVRAAFQARSVAEPHYWIADYDGVQQIPAGAIAKQYQNTHSWDLSIVADYWPGVDPNPTPGDPRVRQLQDLLNADGASLVVDGVKGPLTKGAFAAAMTRVGTLAEGSSGLAVKVLQAMLNTWWSFGWRQLATDGSFGPITQGVVEQFQVARDVPDSAVDGHGDGRVGPATKAALAV